VGQFSISRLDQETGSGLKKSAQKEFDGAGVVGDIRYASLIGAPMNCDLVIYRKHALLLFALFALTLLAYSNSFQSGFAFDNRFLILDDPRLTAPTPGNLNLIFTQDYCYPQAVGGVYRPVTTLTYLFNYAILGSRNHPASYHWINMALHWLTIALVFQLVLRVLRDTVLAFAVTAVWALHPVSTECVTNIIGRANLISASAVLAGVLCHLKAATASGWRKAPWLLALAIIVTIGMFSKESTIVVLAVMLIYDVTFWNEVPWLDRLPGYFALSPPLLLFWQVREHIYRSLPLAQFPFVDNPLFGADFWTARITAVKVLGKYLWLLVFPRGLSCDYSYNQIPLVTWRFDNWEDWKALVALAVCVLAIAVAIKSYRRSKPAFFFIAFFFATMAPTSNLIILIGPIMAERFLYLPSLGFAGCLVVAIDAVCRRAPARYAWSRWLAPSVIALICLAFGFRTYIRNFDWIDDVTLWTSAVQASPASFKTHRSLAYALNEKYPHGERLNTEISEIGRSLEIQDSLPNVQNSTTTYSNAGTYYRLKGDLSAAPEKKFWYRKSLDTLLRGVRVDQAFNQENRRKELLRGRLASQIPNDGWSELYMNLGIVYMRLNDPRKALVAFTYGRSLSPQDPKYYQNIAAAYSSLGDNQQAAVALTAGLLVNPGNTELTAWLDRLYRQIDPNGCAVAGVKGKPHLDMNCPLVREHVCLAYQSLVLLSVDIKQDRMADNLKTTAVRDLGCPAWESPSMR
jgi:tetratricopeptide (TPR) repeat protein